jgi:tetratricopeptide (TPR) repeat protein
MDAVSDVDDRALRQALVGLLGVDSFPRSGALLRANPRLLGDEARGLLDRLIEEAAGTDLPHTAALASQYRSFLCRCAPDELDAVFPEDNHLVDPQVVAAIEEDLDRARVAEAVHPSDGGCDALDGAVEAWGRVLAAPALAGAYPDLCAALLNDAAGVLLRRFWHCGRWADLVQAAESYGDALDLTPRHSARRVLRLGNLAMVGREIHVRSGAAGALEGAEILLREAIALVDRSRGALAGTEVLTNLALVLRDRYLLSSDIDVLEDAVGVAERACITSDAPGPRIMLGDLLSLRHLVLASVDDVDRAVDLLEGALGQLADSAPERPRAMVDLAVALSERHAVRGDPADLDRALRLIEAARRLLPGTAPDRPAADAQLAVMLYRRFESAGRLDDVDRAVDLLTGVLTDAPDGEVAAPTWRANLATVLIQRYRRTGRSDDLDRAIDVYVELAAAGETSTDRYAVLNNLGNALRDRARRIPGRTDLDRAVVFLREALTLCAEGSTRWAATLSNLAVTLHDRFRLTRDAPDLQKAVELTERALGIGGDDADHARRWFVRALVAQTAAELGTDRARSAAVQAYREGCRIGLITDPESTLIAAQDWGGWASAPHDWDEACEAYPFALDAADLLVTTQVVRDHQEAWLRATPGLADRAAWAGRAARRPVDAVVALERTRAALLSEALQRDRLDLRRLAGERPELGDRYRRAAAALRVVGDGAAPLLRDPSTVVQD